jgi:hypothetical protein
MLRASTSLAWPMLPVSTSCRSKPVALPSSSAAGGMTEMISASRYCDSAPLARSAIALDEFSLP